MLRRSTVAVLLLTLSVLSMTASAQSAPRSKKTPIQVTSSPT